MIIAPPLVMTTSDIDTMMDRAVQSLDEAYAAVKEAGLMVAG